MWPIAYPHSEFAAQSGIGWDGGLALAGGGIVRGKPLTLKHVMQSLNLTSAALAQGCPVPAQAVAWMAKDPIPFVPFALRRCYIQLGAKGFVAEAARSGVSKERLLDRPYTA
jgi:hypothetical protein